MTGAGELYDREDIWGNSPDAYQREVRRDLLSVLPRDIGSVLDVGCGDGFITNALPGHLRVVGLDVGMASLRHIRRETKVGKITALPYGDGEFDLVMANDAIEHIPDAEFGAALAELSRVARSCVLITVPLMENLDAGRTFCPGCGTVYHVNHHQRNFGVRELRTLLGGGWKAGTMVFTGTLMGPAERADRALRARGGLSGGWERSRCPSCGHEGSEPLLDRESLPDLIDVAGSLPYNSLGRQVDRSECICLYRRSEDSPSVNGPEAVPEWSIAVGEGAEAALFPASLSRCGDRVAIAPRGLVRRGEERSVMLCTCGGVEYRLPDPAEIGTGVFAVPLWFMPPLLGEISAQSNAHGEFLAELLLMMSAHGARLGRERHEEDGRISRVVSAQLLGLWEMLVSLRAKVAAQEEEINSLREQSGREADVRHRRDN